jgi:hypothetical protein
MLTYQTHPKEVEELQEQIASGKFFSMTFIKKDGSIRYLNGHKKFVDKTSPDDEKRGKWDRLERNLLTVWDRNAVDRETGKKGAFRTARLEGLLYVKVGDFVRDYTDENKETIEKNGITPEQLEQIRQKMKIDGMVQEEMIQMVKEADFFNVNDIEDILLKMGIDGKSAETLKEIGKKTYDEKGNSAFAKWVESVTGKEVYPVTKGSFSFTPVN